MQPDNSTLLEIHNGPTRGRAAIIEMENGDKPRRKVIFDILSLNRTITNIENNVKAAKTDTSREFHEVELEVFKTALEKLREVSRGIKPDAPLT